METRVSSASREVIVTTDGFTTLIGERINPSGRKKLAEALKANDFDLVRRDAADQVAAGAAILDVNVVTPGVDEVEVLPKVVETVMEAVDAPLCIDINDPRALMAALKVYKGKPLINSVTGEAESLKTILPLVKEYGAAVIGLTMDDEGIPKTAERRLAIAHKIVERAAEFQIPPEDIIIDSLTLTLGADTNAARVTLETIANVKAELGVNQTLGASNISYGLPERMLVNSAFLALAISAGVTCPTVNAAKVGSTVMAIDLILGRDRFAQRYVRAFRQRRS